MNHDVVTLFSNAQAKLFPTNTAYCFTNRLPHLWKIPSAEKWRVGVSEFSTLNTLDNLPIDLTLEVRVDKDARFLKERQRERFHCFLTGRTEHDRSGLTAQEFASRITNMQRYSSHISPEFMDCNINWNPFTHGLAGVTQQMLNQTAYMSYLLFTKVNNDVKIGVKHGDTVLSDEVRFVMSPALQHLLLLDHPTGTQTLKTFDALKDRFVQNDSGTHCDFWYRLLSPSASSNYWPGFHDSISTDPFRVLASLARKYAFFVYEEHIEGDRTVARLKFKEVNNIVMVQFPDNFLKLPPTQDYYFSLMISNPQYQLCNKAKKGIVDAFPLGRHMKQGATTTSFYLTEGAEIKLARKTTTKPPENYRLSNFKLTVYHAQPFTQTPYRKVCRVPRGNYTMESFLAALKLHFSQQSAFEFSVTKKDERGAKQIKLQENQDYRATLKPLVAGYRISLDPRLQSILALDCGVITGTRPVQSNRSILLSNFTYNLMLYCKFIQPNIQGGQLEPVLRTIPFPTKSRYGDTIAMEFQHVEMHKLSLTSLEDLSIEIRDDTGQVVQLADGRTMMKLHFVRAT